MNKKLLKRLLGEESGVGLIELLVSSLIIAGVVAAILVAYSNLPVNSSQGNALTVLQQDASLALEDMATAIRETATDAGSFVVQADQLTTSTATYSLNNGLLLKNGSVILGDYSFEDFGMQVASLSFDDDADDGVPINTVTITLVVNLTHSVVESLTFSTKASPRNRTI